jgi:hypothetical protein
MVKRFFYMAFFFIVTLYSLFCEETQSVPEDKDAHWIVGFSALEGIHLSVENEYLVHSIPLMFREKLISVKKHYFKSEEIIEHQKSIIKLELAVSIQKLIDLQKQRDRELFLDKKEYEKQKAVEVLDEQIEEAKEKINFLRNLKPEQISFPDEKPIVFKDEGGKLYDAPKFSELQYAEEKKLHVLIWGSLEEVQGYLYLEINVFDRIFEKNIYTYREGGSREDLYGYFPDAIKEMTSVLLGRAWSSLVVSAEPQNAYIKINDSFMGLGSVDLPYLMPGAVKIEVTSPGFISFIEEFELEEFESKTYDIKLEKSQHEEIFIQSYPPEADVYLDSLWIGKTPLIIDKPFVLSKLLIKKEDYGDFFIRIGPESSDQMDINLFKIYIDKNEYQEKMAVRFYNSLGAFLISLPFSLFSYGLAYDHINAGHENEGQFFFYTYRWSVFVNCVLCAQTIYDLIMYIRSGDRPQG